MRVDFSEETKRILAQRVGLRCSKPDCRASTSGPQVDPKKFLSVGVASHITAAAPGGPRYDPALSEDQRRHPDNGIWLCQNHGKLVDNDSSMFTVALLRSWKREAEAAALMDIGRGSQPAGDRPFRAEEMAILMSAAEKGDIWVLDSEQTDSWVRSGTRDFYESDPAYAARHVEALRSLRSRGLVKHEGGILYKLTGSGFELGRELRKRITPDET